MACVYVPQRDPTMASLRELLAVRTERKGERPAAWVIENMQFVTRADIPDFHRASPPAARRRPSGLKATARTERLFLANTRPSSPVVTSISSTIPRREWAPSAPVPTASHSPSGLTSSANMGPALGVNVRSSRPVGTCQTLIVVSMLPEASHVPSGLKARGIEPIQYGTPQEEHTEEQPSNRQTSLPLPHPALRSCVH